MNRREKMMLEKKIEKTQEHIEAVVRRMIRNSEVSLCIIFVSALILKLGVEGKNALLITTGVIIFGIAVFLMTHIAQKLNAEFDGKFLNLQMYVRLLHSQEENRKHKEG